MFVRKFSRQIFPVLLVIALLLTGCNVGAAPAPTLDINAINTAVVGTTVAQLSGQFTQTALAAPTSTPLPTNPPQSLPTFELPTTAAGANALPTFSLDASATPLPGLTQIASPAAPGAAPTTALGDACNNSEFTGEESPLDGAVFKPGEDFKKVWEIKNTGNCTWDEGYELVFIAGDKAIDPYDFKFKKAEDFVSPGETIDIGIKLTAPLKEDSYEGHWRMRNDQGYYFGTLLSVYFDVRK